MMRSEGISTLLLSALDSEGSSQLEWMFTFRVLWLRPSRWSFCSMAEEERALALRFDSKESSKSLRPLLIRSASSK